MTVLPFLLAASVWAAPSAGPAPCSGKAAAVEPETLDDLAGCQRRALDEAAVVFAQANKGSLPSDALVARWQKAQDAETRGYLARHPERKAPTPEELAARAPKRASSKSLKIYVAPWCPHCREATARIKALRSYLADKGVDTRVIVGKDSTEKCQEYAQNFGADAEIDPAGVDMPSAGVPYFLVTARDGGVLKEQAGVDPNGSAEDLAAELGLP